MELEFQVRTKIMKPVDEVFDAVYNPEKLSRYFTSGGASAPLVEGTTVEWAFEDKPGMRIAFPVVVEKVVKNESIRFQWEAAEGGFDPEKGEHDGGPAGYRTTVEMTFESVAPGETTLRISERGWRETPAALRGSYGNCQGWTHMSLCLKANLEFGIDLRKNSF